MQEDNKNEKKIRHFFFIYIAIIIVITIIIWGFGQIYTSQNRDSGLAMFTIKRNQGVLQISSNLVKEGFINSKLIFIAYSILSGHFSEFKPGTYMFSDSMSMRNIIEMLTRGPDDITVIFYPGMTMKEMDGLLSRKGLIKKGEFANLSVDEFKDKFKFLEQATSLEGYLMPDTYKFHPDFNAKMIAEIMLKNFWNKVGKLLEGRGDIDKIIKVASLVEKEVAKKEDKPLVASVIYNRMRIGMPLQVDSTIIYRKCNGIFTGCTLDRRDFKKDSPYNTYTKKGLPKTPISNPVLSSIEAAINPAKSKYFYYLSDRSTGKTFFSETFDEHDAKRARYLGI